MVELAVARGINSPSQQAAEAAAHRAHPKMTIVAEGGQVFTVMYAPRETTLDGIAPTFTIIDRPGREPLVLRSGDGLRSMSFELIFARPDPQDDVEDELHQIRVLAASGQRMRVRLDNTTVLNLWRMTSFSQQVVARQHGTNNATRASVSVTFQKASDPVINVGPLTGGARPPAAPAPRPTATSTIAPKAAPATHIVARGDTLSSLALRYLGNAAAYPRIADANGIRDPNRLTVGQRLTIPAR